VAPIESTAGATGPVPEHRERVAEAAAALDSIAAGPGEDPRAWAETLRGDVVELIDAWAMHIDETEQPGGLYEEIIADKPRLAHAVDVLRHEHEAVMADAAALMLAAAVPSSAIDQPVLRADALALVTAVERHQRRGLDLLYDFYQLDIGVGE
jgi:hypothetical protein